MQTLRFALVGLLGFGVDGGLLTILTQLDVGAIAARCVSFPLAVATTFLLNRHFTFHSTGQRYALSKFLLYWSLQLGGAATNFLIYVLLVHRVPAWGELPLVPLGIAASASMAMTYVGSRSIFGACK